MFTPKNIQGALEELYDLCDPDYMVDMLVNYSEEFDDISPALLAKSFQKNAEMISEYRVLSSAGEGIDYQGKVLLNSRAVRLLSYVEDMSGDEKVRTIQSKELWLAEDMTFYVVSCMSTITMDKEEAICLAGLETILFELQVYLRVGFHSPKSQGRYCLTGQGLYLAGFQKENHNH